ncbi:transposase family protein [Streptomyces sp. NPDC050509]|uniref:transposase family protein n=1 Tax=Streptomyces sp. NPDC050509 TaxID=3365620 RepID=UPI0037B2EB6E
METAIVGHGLCGGEPARAVIIRSQRTTGLTSDGIAELITETGPLWHERHQAVLTARPRHGAMDAGAKRKLVFIDRLLATLVHLRHGVTHDVLACWFGVDRSPSGDGHLAEPRDHVVADEPGAVGSGALGYFRQEPYVGMSTDRELPVSGSDGSLGSTNPSPLTDPGGHRCP